MGLSSCLLLSLAVYALLSFFLLPALRAAWRSQRTPAKVSRAGAIAGLETIRRFAAISAITLAICIVLLWAATAGSAVTVGEVQHLLTRADLALEGVKLFRSGWETLLFAVFFLLGRL